MFQAIGGIMLFPVWWYTRGFVYFGQKYLEALRGFANTLAIALWIKNIFVPMYGSYDIAGRIISFVVRLMQIMVRSLAFIVAALLTTLVFALWMMLPMVAVMGLIVQLALALALASSANPL